MPFDYDGFTQVGLISKCWWGHLLFPFAVELINLIYFKAFFEVCSAAGYKPRFPLLQLYVYLVIHYNASQRFSLSRSLGVTEIQPLRMNGRT